MAKAQLRTKASASAPVVKSAPLVKIKDLETEPPEAVSTSASSSHPGKSHIGANIWTTDRSGLPICRRYNSNLCSAPCEYKRSHACSSCGRAGHGAPVCGGPQPAPPWARPKIVPRHAFELSEFSIQKELTHDAA